MERRIVSLGFVDDALRCLRDAGIDPLPVLAEAGLSFPSEQMISDREYGKLWRLIADELDDEFFGLGKRPMLRGSFAMLGHAILHTHDLDQALRRALVFLRLVLDEPHGTMRIQDGLVHVYLHGDHAQPAFTCRTYWIILLGILCWLVRRRIPLKWLDFRCTEPENRPDYRSFFGAPVRFQQPHTRLVFDARYLRLTINRSEANLKEFMRHAPANILVGYRRDHGAAARIHVKLSALKPAEWPNFDRLAVDLNIPPATLRRRLRADGQSFQSIKDELRISIAQKLLRQTDKTLATISSEVGYSEPSAFYRAFAKATSLTPNSYRLAEQ